MVELSANSGVIYQHDLKQPLTLEQEVEAKIAKLEHAKYAVTNNSGVSSITIVMQMLPANSKIMIQSDFYAGTRHLLNSVYNGRLQYIMIEPENHVQKMEEELSKENHGISLVQLESPSNPLGLVYDVQEISRICKKYNVLVCFDNTFCSPIFMQPLDLGVDIVLHSATKYIAGHSDCLSGVLCVNDENLYKRMLEMREIMGQRANQFNLNLINLGLQTLQVRTKRIHRNALRMAEYLQKHPKVKKVLHPSLKDHPGNDIMVKQSTGMCGTFSFYLDSDNWESICEFPKNLHRFEFGPSLGGVCSSMEHFGGSMRYYFTEEQVQQFGYTINLFRVSVGIENVQDLIDDIDHALEKLEK